MKKQYQIRVKGILNGSWSDWFYGWTMTAEEDGTTVFTSQNADESSLHGLLAKIRNLNLPLISVNSVDAELQDSAGEDMKER